jgi:hypothetical protein
MRARPKQPVFFGLETTLFSKGLQRLQRCNGLVRREQRTVAVPLQWPTATVRTPQSGRKRPTAGLWGLTSRQIRHHTGQFSAWIGAYGLNRHRRPLQWPTATVLQRLTQRTVAPLHRCREVSRKNSRALNSGPTSTASTASAPRSVVRRPACKRSRATAPIGRSGRSSETEAGGGARIFESSKVSRDRTTNQRLSALQCSGSTFRREADQRAAHLSLCALRATVARRRDRSSRHHDHHSEGGLIL